MLSYLEARDKIQGLATPLPIEQVPLTQALNRVLARPIFADRDYPPFNRAAMDGVAIRMDDWLQGFREFKIRDSIFAGMESSTTLERGECYKIMTGAACPQQVNTVIRNEDLCYTSYGTAVVLAKSISQGQHIAKKGEDLQKNERAIDAPTFCDVSIIGVLAALGISSVSVYKMPTVAIITSGNEVVAIDQPAKSFQIRNSNQYLLSALCAQWQLPIQTLQHVPDDPQVISAVLEQALGQQLILINGGVSAGDADYVPQILRDLGVEVLFHKVSIKPGKPLLVGYITDGPIIFALPGNPLSCLITFKLFVEEYLHRSMGFSNERFQPVKLQRRRSKKSSIDEFFPVFRRAETYRYDWKPMHGSGDITATIRCDGIGWQVHDQPTIAENDTLAMLSFHPFFNIK